VTHFQIPITAKIRIGWNKDSLNYIEVAKTLEGSGASMIAVHGRSRDSVGGILLLGNPLKP